MAIATLEDISGALRQKISYIKANSGNSNSSVWVSYWDGTGTPAAGSLAIGNTANGVVPTDATTGAANIEFISGSGYISWVEFSGSLVMRIMLYDRIFHAGSYSFNASTTLASQPSYSSRVPGGTDYKGTQLWMEIVTSFTGTPSIAVTYSDQDGNTAHTTGTVSLVSGPTRGRLFQLPLASGDCGISKIESVTATVATVGTFNLFVARPLWTGRADEGLKSYTHPLELTGMPLVFNDSCIAVMMNTETSNGTVEALIEIVSG